MKDTKDLEDEIVTALVKKVLENYYENTNSSVDKKERRKELNCSYCRPHKNENAGRKPKHGVRKKRKQR